MHDINVGIKVIANRAVQDLQTGVTMVIPYFDEQEVQ